MVKNNCPLFIRACTINLVKGQPINSANDTWYNVQMRTGILS